MNIYLAPFVKMLNNRGLITFNVTDDTDEGFENRLKLQKYVFLARHFGLEMDYQYGMYLHGPYSSGLAEDYYSLGTNRSLYESTSTALPAEFNYSEFMELVKGKDPAWLEVAATMLSLRESFNDRACLLERTVNMKGKFGRDMIETVMLELEQNRLLTF